MEAEAIHAVLFVPSDTQYCWATRRGINSKLVKGSDSNSLKQHSFQFISTQGTTGFKPQTLSPGSIAITILLCNVSKYCTIYAVEDEVWFVQVCRHDYG